MFLSRAPANASFVSHSQSILGVFPDQNPIHHGSMPGRQTCPCVPVRLNFLCVVWESFRSPIANALPNSPFIKRWLCPNEKSEVWARNACPACFKRMPPQMTAKRSNHVLGDIIDPPFQYLRASNWFLTYNSPIPDFGLLTLFRALMAAV